MNFSTVRSVKLEMFLMTVKLEMFLAVKLEMFLMIDKNSIVL